MDAAARAPLEAEVRRRCDEGDPAGATTAALRGYGPEIYGFLCALQRDEGDAADAFSLFSEDVWRGLPRFAWECSLRTWLYTVARHASHRLHRGDRRRREVPLSDAPEIARVADEVRTATRSFLRTDAKDAFARVRATLAPEDEALLVLRIDRRLEWAELARVLGNPAPDDVALKREAARLRKRFQLLKERLVALGREHGLLPREG